MPTLQASAFANLVFLCSESDKEFSALQIWLCPRLAVLIVLFLNILVISVACEVTYLVNPQCCI